MNPGFVHLRLHTEYSLVDGLVRVRDLMAAATAAGLPAVAMTDQGNLFALVKFYRAAQKAGLKPLIGVDLWVQEPEAADQPSRLSLLCQNDAGYRNLTRLVTRSWLEGQHQGVPLLHRDWLDADSLGGLIALSGGREGDVGQMLVAGKADVAQSRLAFWRDRLAERYYLELQRTGRNDENRYIESVLPLAAATDTPVVATNDVRFLDAGDFEAHEARVCIHDGYTLDDSRRVRRYSAQQYLRTPAEMAELFADIPEALANSVEIARRCNVSLDLGRSVLPDFPVPEGHTTDSHLRAEAAAGLDRRLGAGVDRGPGGPRADYDQRLARELGVIEGMGFAGYFLIVADFIRWARNNHVPVGPGRGSGAGSLVAWCLGITDLDPLEHNLLFERFLNPERVSMPDFDVDFCMDGRDRVIDYVAQRYGRDRVSQIITHGTMAAKAVVRDVGRVLGHPFGFVDRIAKLIPFELGITLEKALDQDADLRGQYEQDDEVRTLIDLARQLEGLARNAGKHAGGVVIAPSALTDFTPLYCEEGGQNVVTQLDKDDVEAVGLVKFDFLGLRTLTIIDKALATINTLRQDAGDTPLAMDTLRMDDAATYALLGRCSTTAVFQLESRGMKDLIKRLRPDCFEDIVALVALFRPGPLQSGMVDDFIKRKHGEARINYPHPDLEPILKPTYGVILYQEQVMQIAQDLAGYSLGGADLLRRAMGKKKPEEMAKQRSVFVNGAQARGVEQATATYIFDLMEKFAGYGFNRSHSAAYAVLSYQTAWLKAHYPAAFMAAVLSADMDNTDKVVTLIDECQSMELPVDPPDVNESRFGFDVRGVGRIRYGLGAIKGVGQAAVENLVMEREANGPYASLADLCARIDLHRFNRRVLEALIRAGAMDTIGPNRATMAFGLESCLKAAEQAARACEAGQNDLFGGGGSVESPALAHAPPLNPMPEWSERERLAGERETLGLFLTGHPIAEYEAELKYLANGRIADLTGGAPPSGERPRGPARQVVVAGLVLEVRKRGNRVSCVLDDRSGRIEATFFEDTLEQYRHILARDAILVVEGALRYDDFINDWRIRVKRALDIDSAREQYARRLVIRCPLNGARGHFVTGLRDALEPYRDGECSVTVVYQGESARARLEFGDDWRVRPTSELIARLSLLVGRDSVRVLYPRAERPLGDL